MATFARAHTFPSLVMMLLTSLTGSLLTSLPAAAIETNSISCNPSCISPSTANSSSRNDSNDLNEQLRSLTQSSNNDDKEKTTLPGYTSSLYGNERETGTSLNTGHNNGLNTGLNTGFKQDDNEHGHGGLYGKPSSSIPEAETCAMMLTGVGILALRVRRPESIPIESD